jgi:hypothetical protein
MYFSYIVAVNQREVFQLYRGGQSKGGISVISWWSILLVEETGVPGENHRPAKNSFTICTQRSKVNVLKAASTYNLYS